MAAQPSNDESGELTLNSSDSESSGPLAPEDFYYDGPYMVFTEIYHLRRGTCCQSGCRHCPYGFKEKT